jgi:hypothetical protein
MRLETIPIIPSLTNDDVPAWSASGWCQITLLKESTGDVVFGTNPNLVPLTAGAGTQLPSSVPISFFVPGGTRLYFAAKQANERVSIIVTRFPSLDLLEDFLLGQVAKILPDTLNALRAKFWKR